jgi:hypothetical protein
VSSAIAERDRDIPSDRDYGRDDRSTIALFGVVVATVIAALYYAGRIGFENPAGPIAIALGIALFIGATPFIAWWLLPRGHYDEQELWWRSQPSFTLLAIAVSALAGMLVPLAGVNLAWIIAGIGYLSALVTLGIWMSRGKLLLNILFVAGAAIFAVWACGVAWSTRYKTPVFWETLEYRADVHHDPLYYVSMANNMRTYGVPSTGLDGVPYTPYHYGSAWLNSQWAYLAGTDVLAFYSLGPSVIVIPLFFCAILLLAVEAKKGWSAAHPEMGRPLRTDYAAWLVFLAVSVGVIPSSGLDALGIWNRHALISESYVIGLPVFLLIMSTAVLYWRTRKSTHRRSDLLFLLLFAPVMLVVAGFLKVSTMLLLLAAGLVVGLLGRLFRDRVFALAALLCFVASLITYKLVSVAAQNQGIVPFAYMRAQINAAWWPYFLLAHLFWSWVYIYFRLREEGVHTVGDVREAALHGRITDVVVVAMVAISGWAAGEVLDIHGGSAIYFSDVQRWLSLSLLMASAWRWLARRRAEELSVSPSYATLGGVRISRVWAALLIIPISISLILNIIRMPATAARANVALRRAFYAEAGVTGPVGVRGLANPQLLSIGLRRSPDYALISTLRSFDRLNPDVKRHTVVFIPQSDTAFWRIWSEPERCSFVPLIVPATSGLALIDGMPPVDCDLTVQYGMTKYKRRTVPQQPADVTPYALCRKANDKGFSSVLVLSQADSTHLRERLIACPVRIAAGF